MTEDSSINRSWTSVARSDADADLLQRSINHVENLLTRLEYGASPLPEDDNGQPDTAFTAATAAPAKAPPDGSTPMAGTVPPTVRADALRVTLNAHDEANRIRAQAAAVHAEAVAESERLLSEAQHMCDRLRADAISEAASIVDQLRTATQAELEATKRNVRQWVDATLAEAAAELSDGVAAELAAEADAVRSLAHDTFSIVVERLWETLECLQQLTSAIAPHAPLAAALAERQRRVVASDDHVALSNLNAGTETEYPAEAPNGEAADLSGRSRANRGASGTLFQATRR